MPSPERPGDQQKEPEPISPYYKAARFSGEKPSGQAYLQAAEAAYRQEYECDLSVFRFQLNQIWHVAVLGPTPPEDLEKRLDTILSSGESTSLPYAILRHLQDLRD